MKPLVYSTMSTSQLGNTRISITPLLFDTNTLLILNSRNIIRAFQNPLPSPDPFESHYSYEEIKSITNVLSPLLFRYLLLLRAAIVVCIVVDLPAPELFTEGDFLQESMYVQRSRIKSTSTISKILTTDLFLPVVRLERVHKLGKEIPVP